MKTFKQFVKEDAPTNSIGTGANLAGLTGDPIMYPPAASKYKKRNKKAQDDSTKKTKTLKP